MRLATVAQAKQIDERSDAVYGLGSEVLMESAGALAAREIEMSYLPELTRGSASVICGPGNNGGDALVAARHLHSAGYRNLQVYIVAPGKSRSDMFRKQLKRAELQGLQIVDLTESPERTVQIQSSQLIVDGLFGIGFRGSVVEPFVKVIEIMNASRAPRVSLDCPSGLNCDSGQADAATVRASTTVTFGLAKPGFFVCDGPAHVGKLRILPVGFPYQALRGIANTHFLFTERLARRYLPVRKDNSNKSDHGRLLVIAGAKDFWGAGVLASGSAFRMGAGYVIWASFGAPDEALREIPEVLIADVEDPKLWNSKLTAVAIGPGLPPDARTAALINKLKSFSDLPVVVDAGAIQACVDHELFPLPAHWVITPHSGELSRLLKVDSQDIERDRFRAVFAAAKATGCHVLLKGYRSLIAYRERCLVIHSGNSALAKAGTGDVLTGMIGGLLAQGLNTTQAAATAAYVHGRLADEWVRSGRDKVSLTASDLKAGIPQAVSCLRSGGSLF